MKKVRWLTILLLVVVLLALGASAAAAGSGMPIPHPPVCRQTIPPIDDVTAGSRPSPQVLFYLSCWDRGSDINEAIILSSGPALKYEAGWDGSTAFIRVFRPVLVNDIPIRLTWCVTDSQGNIVMGTFGLPDPTEPRGEPGEGEQLEVSLHLQARGGVDR
jgi:hypothetical protein